MTEFGRVSEVNSNLKKNQFEIESKNKQLFSQKHERAKDELEYAVNWQRAFSSIFIHLKWLNAFAKINYIAFQK